MVSLNHDGLGAGRRSQNIRPVRYFKRFCETRGPSELVLYETVVNYDDSGALFVGLLFAKTLQCV